MPAFFAHDLPFQWQVASHSLFSRCDLSVPEICCAVPRGLWGTGNMVSAANMKYMPDLRVSVKLTNISISKALITC